MKDGAGVQVRGRVVRLAVKGVVLFITGLVVAVGVSLAPVATRAFSERHTRLVVRGENQETYRGERHDGWAVSSWSLRLGDPPMPDEVPVRVPWWVTTPVQTGYFSETDAFGWPVRALYRYRMGNWGSPAPTVVE